MKSDDTIEIPGKKSRPFDIRDLVLRRSLLVVLVGLAIFIVLSPIALVLRKPYYNAVGTILISPEIQLLVPRDVRRVPGNFREFAMTHAQRIKSEVVLTKVLNDLPREHWPVSIPKELPPEVAAKLLSRQLSVDIVGASRILAVAMNADAPEGIAPTINSVMNGYVSFLESEQERENGRQLSYLVDERGDLEKKIADFRNERQSVSEELRSSTFSDIRNPAFEKLVESQTAFLRASADALLQKANLEKAERDETVLGEKDLSVFAEELVATNEAVYLIDNWTYQKLQELRSNIDGLTEENSDRIVVEERMKAMTDYLSTFKNEMHDTMFGILNRKRDFELETDKTKAESAFLSAKNYSETLAAEMELAMEEYRRSSRLIARGIELNDEIETLTDRVAALDQRVSEVHLESKAPVFLSVEQHASTPSIPLGDNFGKLLAAIFAFSFFSVGSLVIGFEFLDGRVRAPGDVRAALGAVPLDPVPYTPSSAAEESFGRVVADRPKSAASGAIRRAVVRLNREREKNDSKVFFFTGVSTGNGVSALVSNYADSFSHYAGRVLVIEFEDEGEELPSDKEKAASAKSETADAVLAGVPSEGEWVGRIKMSHLSGLLRKRSEVQRLIEGMRERVDVVLIDGRPILDSDLSQFLALHSDSAVIIARRSSCQYQSLRKAIELIFRMELPAMTAVFNASLEQPLDRIIAYKRRVVEVLVPSAKGYLEGKFLEKTRRAKKQKAASKEAKGGTRGEQPPSDAVPSGRQEDASDKGSDSDVILPG